MDHAESFIHLLSTAKRSFEKGRGDGRFRFDTAALDSMLFGCARARRIARDAPDAVRAIGIDPDEFTGFMKDVADHRNVMEHWADVIRPRALTGYTRTTPSGLKISVDEASWAIGGLEEIYKGKLNLYDVYVYVVKKLNEVNAS